MTQHPIHGRIDGPIVMIGFGSIGRGTLPLIERHFQFDKSKLTVIDPSDADRALLEKHGVTFIHQAVTIDNYKHLLGPLLSAGPGQGFCVNLSVDTSSLDIMKYCREIGALYIDTVNQHLALCRIIRAIHQPGQRGFARASLTHNGNRLTRVCHKTDVAQNGAVLIAECNGAELDFATHDV